MELVTAIIQIINAIVEMVSGIIVAGIQNDMDPVARFEWNRDTVFPKAMQGLRRTVAEKKAIEQDLAKAKANVANPANWWNKSLGHSKDPLWMEGQKRIVQQSPGWLLDVSFRRGPGPDNIDGQVASAPVEKQGNIKGYRDTARGAQITVLLFSLLDQAVGDSSLSYDRDAFLDPGVLRLLYPGDPDALAGRLPVQVRGDAFAHYLALIYRGLIDPASPVPGWILGMSLSEQRDAVARRAPWPTALQLLQSHRSRQDAAAASIASMYAN